MTLRILFILEKTRATHFAINPFKRFSLVARQQQKKIRANEIELSQVKSKQNARKFSACGGHSSSN